MAELQQFDLGRVLSQAEAIRGQRQQNRLAELLAPYREREAMRSEQQAQTQVTDEAIQRTARLTGVFLDTIGDIEQMPPEQQQQAWSGAMNRIQSLGADVRGLPMEYSPENLRWARSLGERLGVGQQRGAPTQVSGSGRRVEVDGQQFFEFDVLTPEGVQTMRQPISGRVLTSLGLTPEEEAALRARQAGMETGARVQAETAGAARKEASATVGRQAADLYARLQTAAQSASQFIPRLESLRELSQRVKTGAGADIALSAKRALGIDVADMEQLNAALMGLAQDILGQQTGTKTDFDFRVAVEQSASLGKTPEANARLIDAIIKRQQEAVQMGDRAAQLWDEQGPEAVLRMRYRGDTGPVNPPPPNPAGQPTPTSQPARPGEVRDMRSETLRKYGIQ